VDQMTLGIDVACRAAHQASLADERGKFAWSGRKAACVVSWSARSSTASHASVLWASACASIASPSSWLIRLARSSAICGLTIRNAVI